MDRGLALALTDSQLNDLRTTANPLPPHLRRRYLAMLGAVLTGRSSIGDAELHRLAHDIVGELLAQDEPSKPRRVIPAGFYSASYPRHNQMCENSGHSQLFGPGGSGW
jgi:hypothetical protein